MTVSFTPTLTCQTPGTLSISYTNGIQDGWYTPKDSNDMCEVGFTIMPGTLTHGTASGMLFIKGIPYAIAGSRNFIGTLNWRGFNSNVSLFSQFNLATKVGVLTDGLVIRCNKVMSTDGVVNITDICEGTQAMDICGSIRYRAGDFLL